MEKTTISERTGDLPLIDLRRAIQALSESTQLKGGGDEMSEPQLKHKIGPFQAAIFLNDVNGRQTASVSLEKSFTKDGTTWNHQKMNLLNAKEIDKLICLLQDVKTTIYLEFE